MEENKASLVKYYWKRWHKRPKLEQNLVGMISLMTGGKNEWNCFWWWHSIYSFCVCNTVHVLLFHGVLFSSSINMPFFLRFLETHTLPPTFPSSCQINPAIVKNLSWKVQACFYKWRILIWWICRNKGSIYNEACIPPGFWISSEASGGNM